MFGASVSCLFSSEIISISSLRTEVIPFKNFHQLAENTDYNVLIWEGSAEYEMLQSSSYWEDNEVWKKMTSQKKFTVSNSEELQTMLSNGSSAYISIQWHSSQFAAQDKTLEVMAGGFRSSVHFAYRKDAHFQNIFNDICNCNRTLIDLKAFHNEPYNGSIQRTLITENSIKVLLQEHVADKVINIFMINATEIHSLCKENIWCKYYLLRQYSSSLSAAESSTLMTTDDGTMSSSSTSNDYGVVLLQV
ncbi:hypothetical protein GQR58_016064 [Nymphon striatum]|nr:hypothetical protein GQR58_016064 [Nymphon striatum]